MPVVLENRRSSYGGGGGGGEQPGTHPREPPLKNNPILKQHGSLFNGRFRHRAVPIGEGPL